MALDTIKKRKARLAQKVVDEMLEQMLEYAPDWVETLGKAGRSKNARVPTNTQINAAKTGIEFIQKLMTLKGSDTDGRDLIEAITRAEGQVYVNPDDADGGEGTGGSEDSELPPKAASME